MRGINTANPTDTIGMNIDLSIDVSNVSKQCIESSTTFDRTINTKCFGILLNIR